MTTYTASGPSWPVPLAPYGYRGEELAEGEQVPKGELIRLLEIKSRITMCRVEDIRAFSGMVEDLAASDEDQALEFYVAWYQRQDDGDMTQLLQGDRLREQFRCAVAFCRSENQGKAWHERRVTDEHSLVLSVAPYLKAQD